MIRFETLFLATTLALTACGQRGTDGEADTGRTKEAWDAHSDPALLGLKPTRYEDLLQPKARIGQIDHKPWTDSYWAYNKKNMAWRYLNDKSFDSFDAQIADAKKNQSNAALSPAEKWDLFFNGDSFPLTKHGWDTYNKYKKQFGDDLSKWNWMGICDGWAPASLNVPAPLNAVVAQQGDKKMVFFQGDLRGLASKVYDLNATDHGIHMMGTRCDIDADKVPQDSGGRPVDGRQSATGETFAILQDYTLSIGALEVTHDRLKPQPYWLLATKPIGILMGQFDVYVYRTRADVATDVQAKTFGAHAAKPGTIKIDLYKGCRDVNPGSIHLALAQLLSDAAPQRQSFVAEMSRYKEVWNYPVWGFDAEFGKIRPVEKEAPEKRAFRSPDASFVLPVTAHIVYGQGTDPKIKYDDDSHDRINWQDVLDNTGTYSYNLLDLKYTLEFDANGMLLGGEWDESGNYQINALDFFWQDLGTPTDQLKEGGDSPIKYSQLRKLLDCSRRAPDTTAGVETADGHVEVPAVSCPL